LTYFVFDLIEQWSHLGRIINALLNKSKLD